MKEAVIDTGSDFRDICDVLVDCYVHRDLMTAMSVMALMALRNVM